MDLASPIKVTIDSDSLQTVLLTSKDILPILAGNYTLTGAVASNDAGLAVIPQTLSLDNLKAIEVTVKALFPPLGLDKETPIATLTPIDPVTDNTLDSMPLVQWSQSTLLEMPMLTCAVFFPNTNPSIQIKSLLDTGADMTIFAEKDWPKEWETTKPCINTKGVGGAQSPLQSIFTLLIEGPEGSGPKWVPSTQQQTSIMIVSIITIILIHPVITSSQPSPSPPLLSNLVIANSKNL
ncbi:hypothetical protein WISP_87905 [Willisornis vidua]|uniref:Peptidase A2 domain-containing protein n=1 Tax=Willisornis vidua TaxID=1566151 RepID=A0ABQ9D7X0_9PASS|nr:hypothetical protein WISP_87905 [Willisornis vidua]